MHVCKNCGNKNEGSYCSSCGQKFTIHRITISHLLEEVFHFFTHFEKGFGYTVKQLVKFPGTMQKKYLEGHRVKYQKPFSMFFICATVCALAHYFINYIISRYYTGVDQSEIYFFQHYLVLVQVLLSPIYAFVVWLFFIRYKHNYAEMLVVTLYITSFFFLVIIPIFALKFFWPHLDTKYLELPILIFYNLITFLNFFAGHSKLQVVLLSIGSIVISFAIATIVQGLIINLIAQGKFVHL
jgi:hypothetical protein